MKFAVLLLSLQCCNPVSPPNCPDSHVIGPGLEVSKIATDKDGEFALEKSEERFWPEKDVVNKFMESLERQDFDTAYAIYKADPNWKQHPEKYNDYSLSQFKLDWGPSGDYGKITKHSIDCVLDPPKRGSQSSSGVIVVVIVNSRAEPASLWVDKSSKMITLSPYEVQCHPSRGTK